MCKSHTKKIGALKLSQQDVGKNCIFRGCEEKTLILGIIKTSAKKKTRGNFPSHFNELLNPYLEMIHIRVRSTILLAVTPHLLPPQKKEKKNSLKVPGQKNGSDERA